MKKIDKKPILLSIYLITFQIIIYFFTKLIQGSPHIIGSTLDNKLPFINIFIIPYVIWYLMIFIVPYMIYKKDKKKFTQYFLCYLITIIISNVIYVIYPSVIIRPNIENTNILNFITNLVYSVDTPALNCFPSIHCAVSMMFILYTSTTKNIDLKYKILIFIISVLIMLATLFVKQHVILDLISGNILALIVFLFIKYNKKIVIKTKKLLRI